ncbi:hypothetical protein AGOR_G00234930 [Albula goreensis]|uniref:Uncharacterized protein n=1 Tax=Albula goreensis TaxID=1534307 RepID=A0A8T3CGR4_9TELE|nr:hypothetical protein AGOR_G00234930 [Albula goreensis]
MPVSLRQQNKPLPSTHHSPHCAERHGTRTMAPADRLLVVAALFAGLLSETSSDALPAKEMMDCLKKQFAASHQKSCWFDAECEDAKFPDALKTCLLYGQDLIFQDSTYQKKNDVDTYNLIQCGIEECFEGVKMYYRQQRAHPTPAVSSLAESFYHCLRAARVCVTSHTVWDMQ